MASPEPCAAPDSHTGPALTSSNTGLLPLDAVYEILLHLPAKTLCRFRAVCRPWRSLLSDPHFIVAHAARHPGPLLIVGYPYRRDNGVLADIVDLSGHIAKQVRTTEDETEPESVESTHLDLVCIARGKLSSSSRLLNPATGAVCTGGPSGKVVQPPYLPAGSSQGSTARSSFSSTSGERHPCVSALPKFRSWVRHWLYVPFLEDSRKNMRHKCGMSVITNPWLGSGRLPQQGSTRCFVCEVFTLDGSNHARWRALKAPPDPVRFDLWTSVVINGIVYFMDDEDAEPDRIGSFDLEAEEWRLTLR